MASAIAAVRALPGGRSRGLRETALTMAVCLGTLIVLATELLGVANRIDFTTILGFWLACIAMFAFVAWRFARSTKPPPYGPKAQRRSRPSDAIFIAIIVYVVVPVGFVALIAAPNNFDSQTYHLPRVEQWIQNRSLRFFPVGFDNQLIAGPFAEIVVLHLRVLAGSDRFANLVQFTAWLGCIGAASLVAGYFRESRRAQLAAAALTATLPVAILQGSSTQTDLVAAFWLITFVHFALRYQQEPLWRPLALAALALGLGIYTKGTMYFFALPFAVWLGLIMLRRLRWRAIPVGIAVAMMALSVNAGHYLRNLDLYGHPLGGAAAYRGIHSVERPGVGSTVSNLIRNTAMHFRTPSESINDAIASVVVSFHDQVGWDASDPRTTYPDRVFEIRTFKNPPGGLLILNEDFSGNPLHLIIGVLSILMLAAAIGRGLAPRWHRPALLYGLAVVAGYLIYCFSVRWNPWVTRVDLPLFVLLSPISAAVLVGRDGRGLAAPVCLLLFLVCQPFVFFNHIRPLLASGLSGVPPILQADRDTQYFAHIPEFHAPYKAAIEFLRETECRRLGLSTSAYLPWEYPIWPLARTSGMKDLRVRHIGVDNETAELQTQAPFKDFEPCALLAIRGGVLNGSEKLPEVIDWHDIRFSRRHGDWVVGIYLPAVP